jgi:hypothetical protein
MSIIRPGRSYNKYGLNFFVFAVFSYGKNLLLHMAFMLNNFKALNKFINENDCFSIHNNVLYCDEIEQYVPSERVLPLRKHLLSKSHANNAQIKEKAKSFELYM